MATPEQRPQAKLEQKTLLRRRDWLGLVAILIIAAVLRVETVPYQHFRSDEADLAQLAQGIVIGSGIPTLGITSSVGIPNSPISDYMVALAFFISSSPLIATIFVALWNVLGVALLWWLALKLFNPSVAFLAALLYAVSPWAIWYSSKIWIQDLHTPLVLLSLILGIFGFIEGKRWAQLLFLPVFVAALQIHFATWALLPIFFVLLWLGRRQLAWLPLGLSVLLAGLILYPFAAAIIHTGTSVTAGAGILSRLPGSLLNPRIAPLTFQLWFSTGLGMTSIISYFLINQVTASLPTLPWLWLPLSLLAVVGVVVMWKLIQRSLAVIIVLWIALPIALFIPNWTPVLEHYFIASIPAYCMLSAVGIYWLVDHSPRRDIARTLAAIGISAVLITQVIWYQGMLHYIDVTPLPEQGAPLHYEMAIRDSPAITNNVLVAVDDSKVTDFRIWRALLFNPTGCVRPSTVQKGDTGLVVLPQPPFSVLTAPDQTTPLFDGLYTTGKLSQFPLRPTEGSYSVYTFDQRLVWNGPAIITIASAPFDNGMQVTGYRYTDDTLYLQWKVAKPPPQNYQYFIHLLNAAGDKVGQRDTGFSEHYFLCAGDQIITWSHLPRPTTAVTLRVGMYTFDANYNPVSAATLDSQANRGLPWVDAPLP
jgi:4-amino-4-deoxy-L-arabinose transferase-like glycosyltransferase